MGMPEEGVGNDDGDDDDNGHNGDEDDADGGDGDADVDADDDGSTDDSRHAESWYCTRLSGRPSTCMVHELLMATSPGLSGHTAPSDAAPPPHLDLFLSELQVGIEDPCFHADLCSGCLYYVATHYIYYGIL